MKKRIGLYFGSFNPIHIGHMIIASYIVEHSSLDQVWMVVTPQNPHKKRSTLAKDHDRLHLVQLAISDNNKIKASDIEFALPVPSYTIDTLIHLREKYPLYDFTLIMGGDNLGTLHKWKNYELILRDYEIYVYKRPNYELGKLADHDKVTVMDAPLLEISSSYIRKQIKEGKSVQYMLPYKVYNYLLDSTLYK